MVAKFLNIFLIIFPHPFLKSSLKDIFPTPAPSPSNLNINYYLSQVFYARLINTMYIFVFLLRNSDLKFFRRVCTLFYIRKRFIRTFMMKLAKKLRMSQEYCHL